MLFMEDYPNAWNKYRKKTASTFLNLEKKSLVKLNCSGLTLDLMCGPYLFSDCFPHIVGVDWSKEMLKLRVFSEFLVAGNAKQLPFKTSSFKNVICMGNTFPGFDKKEGLLVLKEARRILKRRGVFVLSYNKRYPMNLTGLKRLKEAFSANLKGKHKDWLITHPNTLRKNSKTYLFTSNKLKRLIRGAGFRNPQSLSNPWWHIGVISFEKF